MAPKLSTTHRSPSGWGSSEWFNGPTIVFATINGAFRLADDFFILPMFQSVFVGTHLIDMH